MTSPADQLIPIPTPPFHPNPDSDAHFGSVAPRFGPVMKG